MKLNREDEIRLDALLEAQEAEEYNPWHDAKSGRFSSRAKAGKLAMGGKRVNLQKQQKAWKKGVKTAGKILLKTAVGVGVGIAASYGATWILGKYAPAIGGSVAKGVLKAIKYGVNPITAVKGGMMALKAIRHAPKVAGVAAGAVAARGVVRGKRFKESVEEAEKAKKAPKVVWTAANLITFFNQMSKAYDKASDEDKKDIVQAVYDVAMKASQVPEKRS